MFKHLFKLIWNKKKQNSLLIAEMLVSFMVIFAVFSLMAFYYQNFNKPMGFEYEDVWVINYQNNQKFGTTDSANLYYEVLTKTIKSLPQVKEVSYAHSNIPFANSTGMTGFTYKGKEYQNVNNYHTDERYKDIFNMKVLEGRWFTKQDMIPGKKRVLINETLREDLFGKGKAIGQVIGGDKDKAQDKMTVIGVVQDMKDKGDYYSAGRGLYNPNDTGSFKFLSTMVIKVTPDADAAFESKLYKTVTNYMKNATVEIEHLSQKRVAMNKVTLIPTIVLLTIAGFLIINVALGLFGVLWYNINKRKGEIGLRRAIGASGSAVSGQIVTEAMFLATLSLIIGTFFAIQFPILHVFDLAASVYITAIIGAVIFIYLLVLVCSLYPGRQAAAVYPAVALHEE